MAGLSTTTVAQITMLTARVDDLSNNNNNRNINNRNNNNQNNNNRNNRGGGPTPDNRVRYVNNPSDDDSSFDDEEFVIDDGSERGNHQDKSAPAKIQTLLAKQAVLTVHLQPRPLSKNITTYMRSLVVIIITVAVGRVTGPMFVHQGGLLE